MIEILKNWVKNVAVIVIFANLIEMLLPNNSLRKYVKVIMGFFILLTILNPILSLTKLDQNVFYPFDNLSAQKSQQDIQKKGEDMREQNHNLAISAYQHGLEQQIRALVLTQPDVEAADICVKATSKGQISSVLINFSLREVKKDETIETSTEQRIKQIPKVQISVGDKKNTGGEIKETDLKEVERMRESAKKKITNLLQSFYNLKSETIRFQ